MEEKGFVTKATQQALVDKVSELLVKNEVTGLKAKLIVTGVSLVIRLGDDVFAEKVDNEPLKLATRKVLEDIFVNGDVDVAELVELALELIDLFKK